MKTFNAAKIISSSKGASNQQIHLQDTIGRPLELNLSPEAQGQLLQAVLSNPPLPPGNINEFGTLRIQGMKRYRLNTGDTGLSSFWGRTKPYGWRYLRMV